MKNHSNLQGALLKNNNNRVEVPLVKLKWQKLETKTV